MKNILNPTPFQVRSMTKDNLFAGKTHVVLARKWKVRVKGRDFIWYLGQGVNCNLEHLKESLIQANNWNKASDLKEEDVKKFTYS